MSVKKARRLLYKPHKRRKMRLRKKKAEQLNKVEVMR